MAKVNLNTRSQLLLAQKVGLMSASMQDAANENKLQYTDGYYYKRFPLPTAASGLQDILLNDDSQKDGYCSISKQKINQGCAFMADRFTFKIYAVATASLNGADEGSVPYGTVAAATTVPVLQDAELEMTVNGVRQWIAPVNAFNHETPDANSDKDGINVSAPVFINDEQLIQFRLHLPQGKSIDNTLSVFVEVVMYGAECRIAR
jgi:hypothetical protein